MWRPGMCLMALACGDGPAPGDPSAGAESTDSGSVVTSDPGSDTGSSTPADSGSSTTGDLSVSCAVQPDNALRFDCVIDVDPPGAVSVAWSFESERHTFHGREVAARHVVPVWGIPPETTVSVEAWADAAPETLATAQATTSALPAPFVVNLAVTPMGAYQSEFILFNHGCQGQEALLVVDAQGRVRWYADPSVLASNAPTIVRGFQMSGPDTLVMLLDRDWVAEISLAGEVLHLQGRPDGDFTEPVHHDVASAFGHRFALFAEVVTGADGGSYVSDGVHVLDASGVVASWRAVTDFPPFGGGPGGGYWGSEFGQAIDWAHANALAIGADGTGYVSLRALQAIVAFDADPGSATFGALRWTLVGDPARSRLSGDLSITSSTGATPALSFQEQHHVSVTDRGTLLLFDNRAGGDSRVLEIAIDAGAGVADIVGAWTLDRACPGQGSASFLPGGNILADCAPARTVVELDAGTGVPVLSMTQSCPVGQPIRPLYRAIPITLFPD